MTRLIACAASTLCIVLALSDRIAAAESSESKTSVGLTVYLGIVPAEIVKGPVFFHLPSRDLYTVKLNVERPGGLRPLRFDFKDDHR